MSECNIIQTKRRKSILKDVMAWLNFEDIMLSEINQAIKEPILYDSTYMWYLE